MSTAAIRRIRNALNCNTFTSGTCPVSVDSMDLYYRLSKTDEKAEVVNLARATPEKLQNLISACDAAPFGRGNETVLDESYRKALKLDTTQFSIPFDLSGTRIINQIQRDLVDAQFSFPSARSVRTELYKLNIYDEGSFFKPHKDTPRSGSMFGSLVIILPTKHEGGNLVLTQGGNVWDFDGPAMLENSAPDAPSIAWVAFYSDITHEVLPVTSGARITLTYNLYFDQVDDAIESARSSEPNSIYTIVKDSLLELVDAHKDGHIFAFGLEHSYPIPAKGLQYVGDTGLRDVENLLKGNDALIYAACMDLKLDISAKVIYDLDDIENKDDDWFLERPRPVNKPLKSDNQQDGSDDDDDDDEEEEELRRNISYMADSLANGHWSIVEHQTDLFEESDRLDRMDLTWVTPRTSLTKVESQYIEYGNEASLVTVYGYVCMSAKRCKAWD